MREHVSRRGRGANGLMQGFAGCGNSGCLAFHCSAFSSVAYLQVIPTHRYTENAGKSEASESRKKANGWNAGTAYSPFTLTTYAQGTGKQSNSECKGMGRNASKRKAGRKGKGNAGE